MEFKINDVAQSAIETVVAVVELTDVAPRHRYGSSMLWRPEQVRVSWTRDLRPSGWSNWSWRAQLTGPWLRKDGTPSARATDDRLHDGADEWAAAIEATRPTHAAPVMTPIEEN